MEHEDDSATTTNNNKENDKVVDLTMLNTWIVDHDDDGDDDVNDDDEDDAEKTTATTKKPSFERMLRRCQQTQLQKVTSREAVQSRLKTFRPLTYFCKPASLSPLVCARFGYVTSPYRVLLCMYVEECFVLVLAYCNVL
jgi:C3HC zinc finger-like